jgi:C1A family cysteine protease
MIIYLQQSANLNNMKRVLIFWMILAFAFSATSQVFKLSRFYEMREANAPQEVKNQILKARQEIAAKKLGYSVGFTSRADIPLERITGEKQLTVAEESRFFQNMKAKRAVLENQIRILPYKDILLVSSAYIYGNPSQSSLDLRQAGLVTPVKDQGDHLTCWSFGAMATFEGSYKYANNLVANASEQYVINCSGGGSSAGGVAYLVFDWMVDYHKNVAEETAVPYAGTDGTCPAATPPTDFYAVNWGIVNPSGDGSGIPTVAEIKDALCKHGTISASLLATDNFKIYTGGPFYDFLSNYTSPSSNHAVAIIGWNDATQCWLIKNSWGTGWGDECGYGTEKGYMWIKYNSSNIGRRAAWVQAEKKITYPFSNGVIWHNFFCIGTEIPCVGDFNGDNKDDIVTFTRGTAADVFVALSNGSKFNGTGLKWHDSFCMGTEIPLVGDFNGDGKDDIATFTRGTAADVYVALSDGSKFNGTGVKWHDNFCLGSEIPLVGDFNGDGKDDIATFTRGTTGDVYVALSDGTKFNGTGVKWHDYFCVGTEIPLIGDVDGDKKDDIITFTRGTTADVFVAKSNGSAFLGTAAKWHDKFCYGTETPAAGDYNGDKKCDILTFLLNATADVYGATSTGSQFNGTAVKVHDWFGLVNEVPMTGDFNGDGKADLITFLRDTQPEPGRGDVYVALAK